VTALKPATVSTFGGGLGAGLVIAAFVVGGRIDLLAAGVIVAAVTEGYEILSFARDSDETNTP